MKKGTLLTVLVMIVTTTAFAQELSSTSQNIKEFVPDVYEGIESMAIEKWDTDYEMVINEINRQSKGYVDVIFYIPENETNQVKLDIYNNAVEKWSNQKNGDALALYSGLADWTMVMNEIAKQDYALQRL